MYQDWSGLGVAGPSRSCPPPAPGSRRRRRRRCRRGSAPPRAGLRGSPPGRWVDVDVAARRRCEFLQHAAGGVVDFHPDVRGHHGAAVGQGRVGDRHLQRVGLQVALAGRQLDVVAGRPGAFGFAFRVEAVAPLLAGQQAFRLLGQVDPGRPPDPEHVRPVLQRPGVPHFQAQRVEEDVGGDLQRRDQVDGAVGGAPGVLEGLFPDRDRAAVDDRRLRRDHAASSAAIAVMSLKVEPVG